MLLLIVKNCELTFHCMFLRTVSKEKISMHYPKETLEGKYGTLLVMWRGSKYFKPNSAVLSCIFFGLLIKFVTSTKRCHKAKNSVLNLRKNFFGKFLRQFPSCHLHSAVATSRQFFKSSLFMSSFQKSISFKACFSYDEQRPDASERCGPRGRCCFWPKWLAALKCIWPLSILTEMGLSCVYRVSQKDP